MLPVSNDYKRQLIAGNRNYVIKVDVTLKGSLTTDFTLTNNEIWDGGITIDEATSSDDTFDIGAAVVGSLKVVINNISGDYSLYDFYDAKLVLWLGVEGDVDGNNNQRYYLIGFYVVDKPTYNGSLITLDCLNNMTWFDVPFSKVNFPTTANTTAGQLLSAICTYVGVFLGTPSFPFYNSAIITKEMLAEISKKEINCREVVQYIAQRCCCYCKMNTAGQLVLKWYDKTAITGLTDYDGGTYNTTTTPYSDGCDLDGGQWYYDGDTYVWTQGDEANGGTFQELLDKAYISQNFDINVSTDDIVVTGVRVRNNTSKDDAYDVLWVNSTLEQTHERYVLIIDNNPFITSATANSVASVIGDVLAGLPIRGYTATSLSDFSYETGDMAVIYDFRGNRYYSWITHFTFTTNNSESFSCGVQSLRKRSEERFSGTVKTLAEANENASTMLSDYDKAVKAMDSLAQSAIGFNEYIYGSGAGRIMYRYDGASQTIPSGTANPKFPTANNVFKITGSGIYVARRANGDIAADGTCTYSNGYDANSGTAILNLIYVQGLNAEWIKAGYIDAARIQASSITGAKIAANTITANKLNVTTLSAIAADMGELHVNDDITIDSGGSIGIRASSNMNAAHISNGDFSIDVSRNSSSWGGLYFGKSVYDVTSHDFGKTYCTVFAGGDDDGGFHVCLGAPSEGFNGNCTSMKFNVFQVFVSHTLKAWLDEDGAHTSSDKRLKKNIKAITKNKVREFFKNINPRSFKYKDDESNITHYGIVAQEADSALRDSGFESDSIVKTSQNGGDLLYVNYQEFHGIELAAIKDLYEIVQKQQEEIAELKARVK